MENLITKLNAFLSQFCIVCKVPCDKQMHMLCGLVISALLLPLVGVYSALWVAVVGGAKEGYDYLNKENHTVDVWDWVATAVGGVVPVALLLLVTL